MLRFRVAEATRVSTASAILRSEDSTPLIVTVLFVVFPVFAGSSTFITGLTSTFHEPFAVDTRPPVAYA